MENSEDNPLAAALHSAFDPYLLADSDGSIVWQNENAMLLFGLDEKPCATLREAFGEEAASKILRTDRGQSVSVTSRNPRLEHVPLACFVLDVGNGAPGGTKFLIGCKSFAPDSMTVRRNEEQLGTIAHDLKNPLGALFGYADALLETALGENFSTKQRDVVERMRSAASRSLELVKNFQHYVQIRQRSAPHSTELSDLNSSVHSAVEGLWRGANAQKLSVELSKGELRVRIDRTQLDRVISNLLTNAFKYTPATGTILLKTWSDGGRAIMMVRNIGAIIPSGELDSVFSRYARASTSKNAPGSGLGLFIVKSILDSCNAEISVASSIESGTNFTVTFPA